MQHVFAATEQVTRMKIYLIGSLRNPRIPELAEKLRALNYDIFDDWYAAGPEADDYWQQYENRRGHTYQEALDGYAAGHVFAFDLHHLNEADAGVLVLPAGKSCHLELGYMIGKYKATYILIEEEPERFDVMYKLADKVVLSEDELITELEAERQARNW